MPPKKTETWRRLVPCSSDEWMEPRWAQFQLGQMGSEGGEQQFEIVTHRELDERVEREGSYQGRQRVGLLGVSEAL